MTKTPAFSAAQFERPLRHEAVENGPTILVFGLSFTILASQSLGKPRGMGFGGAGFCTGTRG